MKFQNVGSGIAIRVSLAMVGAVCSAQAAIASINLELRPAVQIVGLGSTVNVGLYAVADSPFGETFSAMQVIVSWDTSYVQLLGNNDFGAFPLLSSGFGPDPYGINTSLVDGDGMWTGFAFLGSPGTASSAGTLMTTFEFSTLSLTNPFTMINILSSAGNPLGSTIVFHGSIPNTSVTGTLSGATVHIVPGPAATAFWLSLIALRRQRQRRN